MAEEIRSSLSRKKHEPNIVDPATSAGDDNVSLLTGSDFLLHLDASYDLRSGHEVTEATRSDNRIVRRAAVKKAPASAKKRAVGGKSKKKKRKS